MHLVYVETFTQLVCCTTSEIIAPFDYNPFLLSITENGITQTSFQTKLVSPKQSKLGLPRDE
jgi:hypothetical protein